MPVAFISVFDLTIVTVFEINWPWRLAVIAYVPVLFPLKLRYTVFWVFPVDSFIMFAGTVKDTGASSTPVNTLPSDFTK